MNAQHEPFGEALRQLAQDIGGLFRAELGLLKSEASQQMQSVATAGVWCLAGATMGLAFLGALTALLIIALSLAVPAWLAALIITAAWGFAAGSLIAAAVIKLKAVLPIKFDETARSLRENVEWIQTGLNSK